MNAIDDENVQGIASSLYNKFEGVIIPQNPKIDEIKSVMIENGALGSLMSGSGPSVFGIFPSESAQKNAYFALQSKKIQVFLCKSL
jgi:4-diphosphocytidyl-2-C-methyl-D-erythritol kinase